MNAIYSYLIVNSGYWHNWCLVLAIICAIISTIVLFAYLADNANELLDDKEKALYKKAFKTVFNTFLVFLLLTVLIPSQKRITAMILLNESQTCEKAYNFVPVDMLQDVDSKE